MGQEGVATGRGAFSLSSLFCGISGTGETCLATAVCFRISSRKSESDEEAHRPPRGKRAPGTEINSHFNRAKIK